MNFSASAHGNDISEDTIKSLQHWWSLAGVDHHYRELPAALLEEKAAICSTPSSETDTSASLREPEGEVTSRSAKAFAQNISYPDNHDDFLAFLENSENLIEAGWSRKFVLPFGQIYPKIMVITAMPDQDSFDQNSIFSRQNSALVTNMLKAIGLDSENNYFASLALARSIHGRIDKSHQESLKARMVHHIGLVKPEQILLFGDTCSKLFFDQDLLTARKKKQNINHVSSTTDAIVTFHPRILIERPQLKAEAWKDLQRLRIANQ